jgi:hypothetical protein
MRAVQNGTRKRPGRLRGIFALTLMFCFCATVAAPEDYPTPYPRPNATPVLQNDRVNAWEVYWPKGQPTPMHEHTIDQLSITLRGGTVRVTTPAGKATDGHSELGMVVFTRHGTIHQEEGTSDVPQHKIMLEIKPSEPSTQAVNRFPPDRAAKALDNDRLIAWDFAWKAGEKVPMHMEDFDSVTVFLVPGTIRSVDAHGKAKTDERKAGDVVYAARGQALTQEAIAGSPRAIIVQLK